MTTPHVYFPKLDLALLQKRPSRDAEGRFPCKLHKMLTDVEKEGLTDIISWHPDGKTFKVHQPEKFTEEILPRYFKKSKYRSFQRQLNLYGYHRITALKPFWESCYHHPDFSRDDETGCRKINRPLRRKRGQKATSTSPSTIEDPTKAANAADNEMGHRSKQVMMEMVDFMAAPQNVESSMQNRQANNGTPAVEEEPAVTRAIFEEKANEQLPPPSLVRRNSYTDLCESIMGKDCPTCKGDEGKLFDDLLQDTTVSPGF